MHRHPGSGIETLNHIHTHHAHTVAGQLQLNHACLCVLAVHHHVVGGAAFGLEADLAAAISCAIGIDLQQIEAGEGVGRGAAALLQQGEACVAFAALGGEDEPACGWRHPLPPEGVAVGLLTQRRLPGFHRGRPVGNLLQRLRVIEVSRRGDGVIGGGVVIEDAGCQGTPCAAGFWGELVARPALQDERHLLAELSDQVGPGGHTDHQLTGTSGEGGAPLARGEGGVVNGVVSLKTGWGSCPRQREEHRGALIKPALPR